MNTVVSSSMLLTNLLYDDHRASEVFLLMFILMCNTLCAFHFRNDTCSIQYTLRISDRKADI